MTEYLKMVPLPSWWQKLDLNEFPISELFEELLSWNLESKLIAPKYITTTYFGAIVGILNFVFSVCLLNFCTWFLFVMGMIYFIAKNISIYESFEELLIWNSESKLITPKYITTTYFGAIGAILNFCF